MIKEKTLTTGYMNVLVALSAETAVILLASCMTNRILGSIVVFLLLTLFLIKCKRNSISFALSKAAIIPSILFTLLAVGRFAVFKRNSTLILGISSLLGIPVKVFLAFCLFFGFVLMLPSVYTLCSYVLISVKSHNKLEISRMLNLLSVVCYFIGVLMRCQFKITDLLYISHAGGIFCSIVSLGYFFWIFRKDKIRILLRYTAAIIFMCIFIYVLCYSYMGTGKLSTKEYFFSVQTLYHVAAPLISVVSYLFFEEHTVNISSAIYPTLYILFFCLANIAAPFVFGIEPMYKLADFTSYKTIGLAKNLGIIMALVFLVSCILILPFRKKSYSKYN